MGKDLGGNNDKLDEIWLKNKRKELVKNCKQVMKNKLVPRELTLREMDEMKTGRIVT